MRIEAPWSSVQITWSGLRISISAPVSMSPARATPGPSFLSTMRFTPSACCLSAISLMLSTMSVTSSRTPGIDENSCSTPSICTDVMAAPCSDDSNTRRSALPSVRPKPRSSGSATTVANRAGSRPETTLSLVGLMRSCQFFCSTGEALSWSMSGAPCPCVRKSSCNICGLAYLSLDATALARPAPVVRDRRDVADRDDIEACGLKRPQRRLAPRARPSDLDLEILHAVFHRLLAGVFGGDLRGVRGGFARSLEAHRAGRRPRDGVALRVGDGDHSVVEACMHMSDAGGDVLFLAAANARFVFGHALFPRFT